MHPAASYAITDKILERKEDTTREYFVSIPFSSSWSAYTVVLVVDIYNVLHTREKTWFFLGFLQQYYKCIGFSYRVARFFASNDDGDY